MMTDVSHYQVLAEKYKQLHQKDIALACGGGILQRLLIFAVKE